MKSLLGLMLSSLLFSVSSYAESKLVSIDSESADNKMYFHFDFSNPLEDAEITTNFIRRTIEWDMSGTTLLKDKIFKKISKNKIKNIYISQHAKGRVRIRINFIENELASTYHERVSYLKKGKRLTLVINNNVPLTKEKMKEVSRVYGIISDIRGTKLAEHIEAKGILNVDDETEATIDPLLDLRSEDEIPLEITKKKNASMDKQPVSRLVIGMGVLALMLGSVYLVGQNIKKKRNGSNFNNESITVVSQKYLGPKRTLTMVRIAGEYMLLGVTDHNISLIKTLSIVDDELPQIDPTQFGTAVKNIVKREESRDEKDIFTDNDVEDSFTISSMDEVENLMKDKRI